MKTLRISTRNRSLRVGLNRLIDGGQRFYYFPFENSLINRDNCSFKEIQVSKCLLLKNLHKEICFLSLFFSLPPNT